MYFSLIVAIIFLNSQKQLKILNKILYVINNFFSFRQTMITNYHAKYFAHELTRQCAANDVDRLSQSLFDATVDLNPHQINAALFALNNPLNQGVILADEVGLGKTIEAGLVLCQYWSERKRQLIIVCPASLRKQWAQELKDKFNLPSQILDAKTWRQLKKMAFTTPSIIIVSIFFHTIFR